MRQTRPSKRKNKKGAIELGMNTIIIVVIGITLLSLALVWIRGMMGEKGIGGLTEGAFGQAESAISDIYEGTSEDLSVVPETISVAPGKNSKVDVRFSNLEDFEQDITFNVDSAAEGDQKVKCVFATTLKGSTSSYPVPSGKAKEVQMLVQAAADSALGTAVCTVTAADFEKTVIISVEK